MNRIACNKFDRYALGDGLFPLLGVCLLAEITNGLDSTER